MTDLPPDVRDRAAEAARKVDRDYGHWQDWVGSIDEFQHERALSTVDAVVAVVAVVAPEIERPLQARITELEDASRDLVNAVNELAPQRVRDAAFDRLERLVKSAT